MSFMAPAVWYGMMACCCSILLAWFDKDVSRHRIHAITCIGACVERLMDTGHRDKLRYRCTSSYD